MRSTTLMAVYSAAQLLLVPCAQSQTLSALLEKSTPASAKVLTFKPRLFDGTARAELLRALSLQKKLADAVSKENLSANTTCDYDDKICRNPYEQRSERGSYSREVAQGMVNAEYQKYDLGTFCASARTAIDRNICDSYKQYLTEIRP